MESLSGTGARVEISSLWQHFGVCLWVESLRLTSVCHVISDYGSGFLLTSTSTSEPEGVNVMNTQQNALPLSHHSRTHSTLSRDIFPPNCIVFHPETGKIFSDIKSENGIFSSFPVLSMVSKQFSSTPDQPVLMHMQASVGWQFE
jgi:hypothetical protein